MVGLDWLSREEYGGHKGGRRGAPGPSPKWDRSGEAPTPWHCLATHKSEQVWPRMVVPLHACGQLSECWLQSELWEERLGLGTDQGCLVPQQAVNGRA